MMLASAFRVGQRVQLRPDTNAWLRGDRDGEVTHVTASWVYVRLDASGRTTPFRPSSLIPQETP